MESLRQAIGGFEHTRALSRNLAKEYAGILGIHGRRSMSGL
jgi:hypothetical protein